MVLGGVRVGALLKDTGREIVADHVTTLAAQTAYYFFFSLFPLLLFLAPLLSLVADRESLISILMAHASQALPGEALAPLQMVLRKVVFVQGAPGLISFGAALAAWSGSNIFGALMTALNTAYAVDERRPWWKRQLLRLFMLGVGGGIMIAATIVLLGGEDVARFVGSLLGAGRLGITIWSVLQLPVAFGFVVLLAFLTYWLLPNVKQRKSHVLVGAVVTSVLWLCATMLFRLYVQRFPPNPAYGLIGGIMILLTWMYYTMFVVIAGGELTSELHQTSTVAGTVATPSPIPPRQRRPPPQS